jgi:hypothetical protein
MSGDHQGRCYPPFLFGLERGPADDISCNDGSALYLEAFNIFCHVISCKKVIFFKLLNSFKKYKKYSCTVCISTRSQCCAIPYFENKTDTVNREKEIKRKKQLFLLDF